MLDPWIIEEILKKEEERRREEERRPSRAACRAYREDRKPSVTPPAQESERGVMIIDI